MKKIEEGMKETKANLKNLTGYTVAWFEMLQQKYGKGIKRRTSYDEIAQIDASAVVSANQRLYVNREDGFIGLNWRQHEFVTECTILDSVLTIMKDGSLKVAKVADKVFMGREIIHIAHLAEGRRHELLHDGLSGRRNREGLREEVPDRRPLPRQALPACEERRLAHRLAAHRSRRKRKCRRRSTSLSMAAAAPACANSISTSRKCPSAPATPRASPSRNGQ